MSQTSKIEWTETTWNPVVGCSSVSEGCRNCYAAREAIRLAGNPHPNVGPLYAGLSEFRGAGAARRPVFTGVVRTVPERLEDPLRWRKPRRVFVNSMSDLFHPDVPDEFIDRVFAVMALCPQHTFQVLTKRPERMTAYATSRGAMFACEPRGRHPVQLAIEEVINRRPTPDDAGLWEWPLPNCWLGTSVEDQAAADERIPHLLRTPAAVRFLSCEPLLSPIEFSGVTNRSDAVEQLGRRALDGLHWVIVGGESGPGARPCDVAWIRSLVEQCQAAGVPCFTKQLGTVVWDRNDAGFDAEWNDGEGWPEPAEVEHDIRGFREEYQGAPVRVHLRDRKGGDPEEWPEDLRVRDFPAPQPTEGAAT